MQHGARYISEPADGDLSPNAGASDEDLLEVPPKVSQETWHKAVEMIDDHEYSCTQSSFELAVCLYKLFLERA